MSKDHVSLINYVKEQLLEQGCKSLIRDGGERCLYRCETEEGKVLKCAVGCLIPNSKYRSTMEDLHVVKLSTVFPQVIKSILSKFNLVQDDDMTDGVELLSKLQLIHDAKPVSEWEVAFDSLATEYLTK